MKTTHYYKKLLSSALLVSVCFAPTLYSPNTFAADTGNFKKVEDAVEYRQKAFSLIRHQFGQMRAMLKGKKAFDKDEFARRADNLAALAKMPWEGFVAESDMKTLGEKATSALPAIWQDEAKFKELAKKFKSNTAYLAKVAKSGDKKAIGAALGKMGKEGCKACHNKFKE